MKVVVIGAYPDSILSFRGAMIKAMVDAGHQVLVMSAPASDQVIKGVESLGATFQSYDVQRNGLNPIADIKTFLQLRKMVNVFQPDKVLAYTIKPVIWGGLAARTRKSTQFYGLITGLGYAFEKGGLVRNAVNTLVKMLYRVSLKNAVKVIFQNNDNLQLFTQLGLCQQYQTARVHGSGVSLTHYPQTPMPEQPPTFLLIARLLGDKGIREYVAAAKQVKQQNPSARFLLVGPEDTSPDKIEMAQIHSWHEEGIIEYLGETKDVVPFIQQCHIYTLPSYHEGLPRTVLEAMSIGRPILTTDAVGCRETVIDNKNGLLVKVKDSHELAQGMQWFLDNQEQWPMMAEASRDFAMRLFDVDKVNSHILELMSLS